MRRGFQLLLNHPMTTVLHMTHPDSEGATAMSTTRIDAHHHLWDLRVRPQPWARPFPALARSFDFDDLVQHLDDADIAGTVLVQTADLAEETPELLEIAWRQPRIRGVVGWVDLQRDDVADQVAALRALPGGEYLVGIRHGVQSETDPGFLARPAFRRGLSALAELGLSYDMLVKPWQLPAVVDAVAALPGLRVILDHCGKPDLREGISRSWSQDIMMLAQYPSVAVKLSGLVSEANAEWTIDDLRPAASTVIEAFGSSRVMIGSDWPACLPAAGYRRVIEAARALIADLSQGEQAQIEGATATRWYGLDSGRR